MTALLGDYVPPDDLIGHECSWECPCGPLEVALDTDLPLSVRAHWSLDGREHGPT